MATILNKTCTWCSIPFQVALSNKTKRMCSKKCMYEWRKSLHWEIVNCLNCKKEFKRRINWIHYSSGLPTQYCSIFCSLSSLEKKEKLKKWGLSPKNHWNNLKVQNKVRETKKKLYGDSNYNNILKHKETCLKKYGVPYSILVGPKSNGKRISKPQRKLFENIQKQYPDAELEKWLPDVQRSVDIYIPSKKKIIELYGTYWHCDPKKYKSNYYNKSIKLIAEQIWNRDSARIKILQQYGYSVEVIWENDVFE